MANDPGEWYDEQRVKAERLEAELAGARKVLEALEAVKGGRLVGGRMIEAARGAVRRLKRDLECARYVGD